METVTRRDLFRISAGVALAPALPTARLVVLPITDAIQKGLIDNPAALEAFLKAARAMAK